MDVAVMVSPLQPDELVVRNADSPEQAIRIALDYCWNHYPGFFVDDCNHPFCFPYRDKALAMGFPYYEVIQWN